MSPERHATNRLPRVRRMHVQRAIQLLRGLDRVPTVPVRARGAQLLRPSGRSHRSRGAPQR